MAAALLLKFTCDNQHPDEGSNYLSLLYDHSRASCQTTVLSHGTDGLAESKIRLGRLRFLVLPFIVLTKQENLVFAILSNTLSGHERDSSCARKITSLMSLTPVHEQTLQLCPRHRFIPSPFSRCRIIDHRYPALLSLCVPVFLDSQSGLSRRSNCPPSNALFARRVIWTFSNSGCLLTGSRIILLCVSPSF